MGKNNDNKTSLEFETPRLIRDERIIELHYIISRMKKNLAINKHDKFFQETETPKLKECEKELETLKSTELFIQNRIRQVARDEIQFQTETSKNFEYDGEVTKAEIVNSKSEECAEKVFNKVINDNEIMKLYRSNVKGFNKAILNEVKILLPQIDKRFIENKENDKPVHTELSDSQNVSKIKYDIIKGLVSKLPIDITEKVDRNNKSGNQKWKYTEGMILQKIEPNLKRTLNRKQKMVILKHIQKIRSESLKK